MSLIQEAKNRVRALMNGFPQSCVFHDLSHCLQVQEAARLIGTMEGLNLDELEILEIAALFHDTGYGHGADNHELQGADFAETFLNDYGAESKVVQVRELIMATEVNTNPETHLQMVLCDADLSYLGTELYEERANLLRQEMSIMRARQFNEISWLEFNLHFFSNHQYHTKSAMDLFGSVKKLNELALERKIRGIQGDRRA